MWQLPSPSSLGWSAKQEATPQKKDSGETVKPPAGLTMAKSMSLEEYLQVSGEGGEANFPKYQADVQNTWCSCIASTFSLRSGPDYNKNKLKSPSPPALYEAVAIDFVKNESRIDNIGSKVSLPEQWTSIETNHPFVPPLIIVNVQLPSDFSSSFFYEVSDGDGWSLVIYYQITEEAASALKDFASASPALKLFANYCQYAAPPSSSSSSSSTFSSSSSSSKCSSSSSSSNTTSTPSSKTTNNTTNPTANNTATGEGSADGSIPPSWVGRFKVTIRCENIDEFGLPTFITAYNAKPILIRNTGILYRDERDRYIEMDINVHKFSSVPKKALEVLFNRFDKMLISVGFCIESRCDEEMPETLFGCVTLNRPSHSMAFDWKELTR